MSDPVNPDSVNADLWEFPCRIAFKAMATNRPGIDIDILTAIQKHLPGDYSPQLKPSAKGTYVSVTVAIQFDNKHQVEAVYREVRAVTDVKMCL